MRAAIVLVALFGPAMTSLTEGVRKVGAAVLGVAGSLAMFEMIRAGAAAPAVAPVAA